MGKLWIHYSGFELVAEGVWTSSLTRFPSSVLVIGINSSPSEYSFINYEKIAFENVKKQSRQARSSGTSLTDSVLWSASGFGLVK